MGESVSIIVPTINEATGIAGTLGRIQVAELRKAGHDVEVIVVDGGSTDGTAELAKEWGARVIIEPELGYGRAYKTAFSKTKGDIIVTLDGDNTYPGELIPKLVRLLSQNSYNFITTSRFSQGQRTSMRLINKVGNWILSFTFRSLFNAKVHDSQSGMWIFRRRILEDITLNSDGMPFSEEMKVKAFLFSKGVVEVPIPYGTRMGPPKLRLFRDGLMNLLYLFRLFATSELRRCKK